MTAAIVPSLAPSLSFHSDPSVEARKRRREIMASQRSIPVTSTPVSPPEPVVSAYVASDTATISAPRKKRKVSEEDTKKPQMKYDPEVPMTKEAAATWRREQRRKRNRESAAASRQRQRDRIAELETERDGWKVQYEAVMTKIRDLEATSGAEPFQVEIRCLSPVRSKTPEPQEAPSTVTPRASPTSSTDIEFLSFVKQESQDEHHSRTSFTPNAENHMRVSGFHPPATARLLVVCPNLCLDTKPLLDEETRNPGSTDSLLGIFAITRIANASKITIPAVKISGSSAFSTEPATTKTPSIPFLDEDLLTPDPCLSLALLEESTALALDNETELDASLLSAEDDSASEFGEFLLDAVDWL